MAEFMAVALPYITGAGTVLTAAAAAKDAFGGKGPAVQKPGAMPMADDDMAMRAKRRQAAEIQARSGRASTILSQSDKLGG